MTKEVKTVLIIGGIVLAIVAVIIMVSKYVAGNRPLASEALIRDTSHFIGSAEAPVTLIEFGDFQCPSCGQAESIVRQIKTDYPDQVKFVFRHYTLPYHQHAAIMAQASEAAALQGKFWEMHDLIFDGQNTWSTLGNVEATIEGYAQQLSLDINQFKSDLRSQAVKDRVKADQRDGEALGVSGTPTFFLNGQKLDDYSYNNLKARIDQILTEATQEATPSATPAE